MVLKRIKELNAGTPGADSVFPFGFDPDGGSDEDQKITRNNLILEILKLFASVPTENTAPASTDVVPMIDDPSGTALGQYVQFANLHKGMTAASDTVASVVEIATAAETTTGTDAGRAVSPDGLAGSDYGKRIAEIKVVDDATALTTGDGKFSLFIPAALNGYNLVAAHACVSTVSSSGTPTYQIRNVTDSQDMLSTAITIDANEKTSYTAATPPVINTTYDDVATGDEIAIDKDVAGTGEKGDTIILTFQAP